MDQETINLLLGLLLGFLFSLISQFITAKIQSVRDNRMRSWENDDKVEEIKKSITYQRLEQFENFVIEYGRKVSIYEALISSSTSLEDIRYEEERNRFPDWNENLYLLSLLVYFEDENLTNSFFELGMTYKTLKEIYYEFRQKLESGEEFDKSEYENRKLGSKIAFAISKVFKSIDLIKEKCLQKK